MNLKIKSKKKERHQELFLISLENRKRVSEELKNLACKKTDFYNALLNEYFTQKCASVPKKQSGNKNLE